VKKLIFLFCISIFSDVEAFNVGFNQGWFFNSYAHQWSNASYSSVEARRVLDLAKGAGAKTLRMWLFEGPSSNALLWKNGVVVGLSTEFVKNFQDFLKAAKERDINIYITLFDGNMLRSLQSGEERSRWWNLLNNKQGARNAFETNALGPLLSILYRAEFRSAVFGIDVVNEMDAAVSAFRFEDQWSGANTFTCGIRSFVRSRRGSFSAIPVTASVGWPAIPFYNRGAANLILEPNPHYSCVDFWDIHFYSDQGTIENCEKIGDLARHYRKPVYLGEFGQKSKSYNDSLQVSVTQKFVERAKACGFSGALAWRLSDVRPGHNPEARFSFESNGKTRPAYNFIKSWNKRH
jgi:hypothetical protein